MHTPTYFIAAAIAVILSAGCGRPAAEGGNPLDAARIQNEFHATQRNFLTPPTATVDSNFYQFYGVNGDNPSEWADEWLVVRKEALRKIMAESLEESLAVFDRSTLTNSAQRANLRLRDVDALITSDRIVTLQELIATHKMRERLASDLTLLLLYRELRSSSGGK